MTAKKKTPEPISVTTKEAADRISAMIEGLKTEHTPPVSSIELLESLKCDLLGE